MQSRVGRLPPALCAGFPLKRAVKYFVGTRWWMCFVIGMRPFMQRVRNSVTTFLTVLAMQTSSFGEEEGVFNFWYGNDQIFGKTGTAQRFINLLGNLDRSKEFSDLSFSLNGGSYQFLSIGPDGHRLSRKGDFNVEIPIERLLAGKNEAVLEAIDSTGEVHSHSIDFHWEPTATKPNKVIEWDKVSDLNEVAQPIDGLWRIEGDKVISAPEAVGYDRVLGIGDLSWKDYEVLFPFEVRKLDTSAYGIKTSANPALLFTMGWRGHSNHPVACPQPHCGWAPYGSISSVSWLEDNTGGMSLSTLWGGKSTIIINQDQQLEVGKTYWFRGRNEITSAGNSYAFKIWPDSLENEPTDWTAKSVAEPVNMKSGSLLLISHHTDLAIGTIRFTPIEIVNDKIKYTLTTYTDTFAQIPYIALWVIGIIWASIFMKRDPQRGWWILAAFVLFLLGTLFVTILSENLIARFQFRWWATTHLTYVYVLTHFVTIGAHAVAWAVLFWKLLPPKKPITQS